MNRVQIDDIANSDSEETSDEELDLEMQNLVAHANKIQQTLMERIDHLQKVNQSTLETMEKMGYMQGVKQSIQNIATSGDTITHLQADLVETLEKAEIAVNSRRRDLTVLQTHIQNLQHQLLQAPENPHLQTLTTLGRRACEYISTSSTGRKYS